MAVEAKGRNGEVRSPVTGNCTIGDEPWNNGYVLASETGKLLEKLETGPMTDDEVDRSFLDFTLVQTGQDAELRAEHQEGLIRALWEFHKSFGQSSSLGDAIVENEEREEDWRRTVPWEEIPPQVLDLTRRRCRFVVAHAESEGWIARTADGDRWRITRKGSGSLRQGLFTIR